MSEENKTPNFTESIKNFYTGMLSRLIKPGHDNATAHRVLETVISGESLFALSFDAGMRDDIQREDKECLLWGGYRLDSNPRAISVDVYKSLIACKFGEDEVDYLLETDLTPDFKEDDEFLSIGVAEVLIPEIGILKKSHGRHAFTPDAYMLVGLVDPKSRPFVDKYLENHEEYRSFLMESAPASLNAEQEIFWSSIGTQSWLRDASSELFDISTLVQTGKELGVTKLSMYQKTIKDLSNYLAMCYSDLERSVAEAEGK